MCVSVTNWRKTIATFYFFLAISENLKYKLHLKRRVGFGLLWLGVAPRQPLYRCIRQPGLQWSCNIVFYCAQINC